MEGWRTTPTTEGGDLIPPAHTTNMTNRNPSRRFDWKQQHTIHHVRQACPKQTKQYRHYGRPAQHQRGMGTHTIPTYNTYNTLRSMINID